MAAEADNRNDTRTRDETRDAIEQDERLQPDLELALSGGKASRTQIWTVSIGALVVIALVMYGLTQIPSDERQAAEPPAAQTTGSGSSQ
jgi:Flp pilus assembly protein TadB